MAFADDIRTKNYTREELADLLDTLRGGDYVDYTPTFSGGNGVVITGTPTKGFCNYKYVDKDVVHLQGSFVLNITTSGGSVIMTMPVNSVRPTNNMYIGSGFMFTGGVSTRRIMHAFQSGSNSSLFMERGDGTSFPVDSTLDFLFSFYYRAIELT